MERAVMNPGEVAKDLRVSHSKVLGWIRSGELRASNLSNSQNRPQWVVTPAALAEFLELRSNKARGKATNRKPRKTIRKNYFA